MYRATLLTCLLLSGCGSADEKGAIVLEVSGLLPGDTITMSGSSKKSILDDHFNTVQFTAVGNGTHKQEAGEGTYKFTCPASGSTRLAYLLEQRQERRVTVTPGDQVSITCSYQTSAPIANVAFTDLRLRDCVLGTGHSYVHTLKTLNCTGKSISNLAGLEKLTGVTDLGLSNNEITDVATLATMTQLMFLKLESNKIKHGVLALVTLKNANEIRLAHNPDIPCTALSELASKLGQNANHQPVVLPSTADPGVNCTP